MSQLTRLAFVCIAIFCLNAFAEGESFGSRFRGQGVSTIEAERSVEDNYLQRHRPFYFAYGQPLTKIQVSFKTPLITDVPLYFAYTQQMFWALHENSKPFRDLTYNPELFYRLRLNQDVMLKSIDLGLWDHNSNGKAGDDSRSFNANYVRFNFGTEGKRWMTRAFAQFMVMHGFDPTNKDIQDYISPVTLNVTFIQLFDSWVDKSEISIQAAPGGKFANRWDYGGYQASVAFRFGEFRMQPSFYVQYYHGFAETLLNYSERVNEYRVGLIF